MQIFNYSRTTYEFLSESAARLNPLEEHEYLVPASATLKQPPAVVQNEKQVFNTVSDDWMVVPDYRNVPYYLLPGRGPHYVTALGEDLPVGAVLVLPPLTAEELMADRIKDIKILIGLKTPAVVANYTHIANGKTYNLTFSVLNQLAEIKSQLDVDSNPSSLFPVEIVLGYDLEADLEEVVTINTLATFKTALSAILAHVVAKRKEARSMKQALGSMTGQELVDWVDTRA